MTEEAAPPPRPGSAQSGGSTPPPPAATPTQWTEPSTFGPHTGPGPAAHGTPAAGYGPPAHGPAAGFAAGTGYGAGGAGGTPPGQGGPGPSVPPPPLGGAGFTSRYGLVRPREGRYLAGVCAAIGRATNTDPVLWRVLLAVLGFFGGIGILVYVAAWLIIPNEGDTASPVESMLGRGRSSMSPVTVIVLGILVAASFGYIVTDAFRAVLLGAAILVAGALLLNRDSRNNPQAGPPGGPAPSAPSGTPPGPVPPVTWPAPSYGTVPSTGPLPTTPMASGGPAYATATTGAAPTLTTPAYDVPPTAVPQPSATTQPMSDMGPVSGQPAGSTTVGAGWPAPTTGWPSTNTPGAGWPSAPVTGPPAAPPSYPTAAPSSGYRPPFAPHGPYASPAPAAAPPPKPPKPPKRPRERSPLGAVTFSLIFLVLGVVALLDLLDVFAISASAYFAAALATIGLGLLVGTWFGRARWLIALGLVTAAALGTATVAESYDRIRGVDGAVTWAPTDYRDLADRYENSFGDAVLDLRGIDFAKRESQVTVAVNFGKATVVVPPNVDVTTVADVNAGDATIFGNRSGGLDGRLQETTDLGIDGAGGGKLRLYIHVNAGNLEVTR
ncbi:PspC domain-containing protein [Micromonospora luteifusca]|uniref:PspC domain-containing protein n=1 Tax=Micromonospora luteifusca TaxID=709860 RepID=UPI0033A1F2F0